MVGDAGRMANMAAKLGALYLAKEKDQDQAAAKVPPSATATSTSKPVTSKRTPVFNMNPGFGMSPVQTGPTSGVPRKAKVVPRRKKVLFKTRTVNRVKWAMPKESDAELGWGLYDNTSTPQPILIEAPGPQNPEEFLCLKELCKGKSLSVFRVSDP